MTNKQRDRLLAEIEELKTQEKSDQEPYRTGYEDVAIEAIVSHFAEVAARESDDHELDDVEDIYWQLDDARVELERRGDMKALLGLYTHSDVRVRGRATEFTERAFPNLSRSRAMAIEDDDWEFPDAAAAPQVPAKILAMSTDDLVDRFVSLTVAQSEVDATFQIPKFNRLYHMVDAVELALMQRDGDARRLLLPLLNHKGAHVRYRAAIAVRDFAREEAIGAFWSVSESNQYPAAANARLALERLGLDWTKPPSPGANATGIERRRFVTPELLSALMPLQIEILAMGLRKAQDNEGLSADHREAIRRDLTDCENELETLPPIEALQALTVDQLVVEFTDVAANDEAYESPEEAVWRLADLRRELRRRREIRALLALYEHPDIRVRGYAVDFTVDLIPGPGKSRAYALDDDAWTFPASEVAPPPVPESLAKLSDTELTDRFRRVAVEQGDALANEENAKISRCQGMIDGVAFALKQREGDQRRMLLSFLDDPNVHVRLCTAVALVDVERERVITVLQHIAAEPETPQCLPARQALHSIGVDGDPTGFVTVRRVT